MLRPRSIPLPLAGFGLELLEAQAQRSGVSMQAFMADAAQRYLAERDPERPSSRVPRFLSANGPRVGERTVEVELNPELWCALEKDATNQGVPLEVLVTHAAMWLAARLDS
jgi:hypothetical protein